MLEGRQVLQCVVRILCHSTQEELVDRGMAIGPKGVDIERFAEQVKLIRLATKQSSLCDREVSRARLTGFTILAVRPGSRNASEGRGRPA